jgi:hypothetical protein
MAMPGHWFWTPQRSASDGPTVRQGPVVTLMRKLIETANALVKADRTWTPKTA